MKLILLTHEREFDRVTNTGVLVQRRFPELCQRVLWQRKQPNAELLALIENGKAGLLYPSDDAVALDASQVMAIAVETCLVSKEPRLTGGLQCQEQFQPQAQTTPQVDSEIKAELPDVMILLDATWQEAAKMFRQSPYLQSLPSYQLENTMGSGYARRRNQKEGGLCTLECAAILLSLANAESEVDVLLQDLLAHNHKAFDQE